MVTPLGLLDLIIKRHYAKTAGEMAAITAQAVTFARALGLPKTAAAIADGSVPIKAYTLPTDETWPGTNQSVAAYVAEKRKGVA